MGILYIVATPIGNMEDITIRAIKTLFSVDYIACEDTRRTGSLISNFKFQISNGKLKIEGLKIKEPKLISYYDEIEFKRIPEIIGLLNQGKDVALVSDGGTPLISDPGFKLVQECIKRGIKIIPVPGPSSVVTALTVSGLPPNDFRFIGFFPSNQTHRQNLFKKILSENQMSKSNYTYIAFESSHRIRESLEDMKNILGDIELVICRELTKIHEEVFRGKISSKISTDFRGEIVILFTIV